MLVASRGELAPTNWFIIGEAFVAESTVMRWPPVGFDTSELPVTVKPLGFEPLPLDTTNAKSCTMLLGLGVTALTFTAVARMTTVKFVPAFAGRKTFSTLLMLSTLGATLVGFSGVLKTWLGPMSLP